MTFILLYLINKIRFLLEVYAEQRTGTFINIFLLKIAIFMPLTQPYIAMLQTASEKHLILKIVNTILSMLENFYGIQTRKEMDIHQENFLTSMNRHWDSSYVGHLKIHLSPNRNVQIAILQSLMMEEQLFNS